MRELIFIVNAESGGRRGRWLMKHLRTLFPEDRVLPLAGVDIDRAIRRSRDEDGAVVACGGDGTAACVLEASWRAGGSVPIGIVPLGTGNDLARSMGCRSSGGLVFSALRAGVPRRIDRWVLRAPEGARHPERAWFNYLSVGYDARVAHRFHALRRHHPAMFRSPTVNKVLYGMVSLGERGGPVAGAVRLHAAGPIAVPAWSGAVVLANIASYAGGTRLGSGILPDDGSLDAFALPAGLAMGLAMGGIRRAHRLGAHRRVDMHILHAVAMQIDGEPLIAGPGHYRVIHGGTVQVLVPPS